MVSAKKKTKAEAIEPIKHKVEISNCQFTNDCKANEHTLRAVTAIADAVRANAEALAIAAKHITATITAPMINIVQPKYPDEEEKEYH